MLAVMRKSSETAPSGTVVGGGEIPTEIGRRGFNKALVGAAGIAALGTTLRSDRPPVEKPHSEGTLEHEDAHEKSHISWLNAGTALAVTGEFIRHVANNATEKRVFGLRSFVEMIGVESARLGILSLGNKDDKHQAAHEAKDIFEVSYPLMGVLTLLAEATNHIEADEKALFDHQAKIIDEENDNQANIIPDALSSSPESWGEYHKQTQDDIIRLAAQNRIIGAIIAPIGTTYTSSTLINAMNKRMSTAITKQAYAKAVHEAKQSGIELTQENLFTFMGQSVARSDRLMHGKMGYVLNTMTNGANIQGAGFIGDPPNFFYILRNGLGEWAKASVQGLATMNAMAHVNDTVWLAQALGVKDTVPIQGKLIKQMGIAAKDIGSGALKTLADPDYATLRFKKQGAMLDEILSTPENGYSAEDVDKIRAMLGDMETTPFAYDWRGFVSALKPQSTSRIGRMADMLAKFSSSFKDGNNIYGPNVMRPIMEQLRDQANSEPAHGLVKRFVSSYMGEQRNFQTDVLAEMLENMLDAKDTTTNEHYAERLNSLTSLKGEVLSQTQIDSTIADIEELLTHDNSALHDPEERARKEEQDTIAFNKSLEELTKGLGHLPESSRETLVKFWAKAIKADSVSDHAHTGGLSHASKEVLSALATQIPAANAVAISVRKLLEFTPKSVPFEAKASLIMGTAAGLSGVADNVVAYVFCEDVLLKEYKKEYGDDVFDRTPGLKDQITRASLFTAIIGGALTKIGNGPNFKLEKHKTSAQFDETTKNFILSSHSDDLAFKESFNPKAVANAFANVLLSSALLPKPEKKVKNQNKESQLVGAH